MTQLNGKFVWFELFTRNPSKAQAFYGEVLGWKVEKFPMEGFTYEMIKAGDTAIGGYGTPKGKTPAHWISYVSVGDVDAAVAQATKAGGKVVEPASDTPTIGRMARIADPFGAELFLFRGAGDDAADAPSTPGKFHWNELATPDATKALAFYEKVVGWTHSGMDMGEMGTYHVLTGSGAYRGGLMESKDGPSRWLPYVDVADCDATVARAKKLGGTVVVPPMDLADVGRFSILTDPAGASFAVIKPAPQPAQK
jgi:predicted enzyme related to lactoylglutathione lyase